MLWGCMGVRGGGVRVGGVLGACLIVLLDVCCGAF